MPASRQAPTPATYSNGEIAASIAGATAPAADLPMHPHADVEIIAYVREGIVTHASLESIPCVMFQFH